MKAAYRVARSAGGPTFQRALDILVLFVERPTMTVQMIGERLQLPKSSAYRFVRGLCEQGLLNAIGSGRYRLGPRVLQLAEAARQQLSIVDLSSEVMADLAQATGETTLLTTVVGDQALAVRQVAAPQALRLTYQPGVIRPLNAGASAKILFASLDEAHQERLLRTVRFESHTLDTVVDPVRLRKELAQIRAQGYAVTTGEYEESIRAVAAPVLESGGSVWGLSIVGPAFRMADSRLPRLVAQVVEAARTLGNRIQQSASLGPLRPREPSPRQTVRRGHR
jgi:DNA-binding IclR family transcriptional regulator